MKKRSYLLMIFGILTGLLIAFSTAVSAETATYTISYDVNGGSGTVASQTKTEGVALTLQTKTPTLTGHTFVEWNTSADGTGTAYEPGGEYAEDADATLYAQWTANTYTVTLNHNDGTNKTTKMTVTYNSPYGELAEVTRTGYTLKGWYTATSGGTQITNDTIYTSTSDKTIYARWTANTYVVTLDPNGGTITTDTKTVTYDKTYGTLGTPTRTGYKFNGWYTTATGGTQITSTSTVKITEDQTLYARWTANTYTIKFDANGGESVPAAQTKTHDKDLKLSSAKATRTGYTFVEWNTKANGTGTSYMPNDVYTTEASVTLYAIWTANTYTVSFSVNDGSGTADDITVTYDSTYGELPVLTRTGYTFKGWYTASSGGTKITSSTKVKITSNQKLYAQWTGITYTVSFDSQGGSSVSKRTVTYGSAYGTLPTPTRTGYTFRFWATDPDGNDHVYDDHAVLIASDHTLYAQWQAKTFYVTYAYPKGNLYSTSHYDDPYKFPTEVDKAGYTFIGWFTEETGGTQLEEGAIIKIPEEHTVYAQYTANTYTVTFDAAGGKTPTESISVTYDSTYGELPEPTRNGHTFNGWYTAKTGGTKITSTTAVKITEDQTLYARWTLNAYISSVVTKSDAGYTVETVLNKFDEPCDVVVAGYKDGRFVSLKIAENSEESTSVTLEGDMDEIKVMAWSEMSALTPICEAEVIPSSSWN